LVLEVQPPAEPLDDKRNETNRANALVKKTSEIGQPLRILLVLAFDNVEEHLLNIGRDRTAG